MPRSRKKWKSQKDAEIADHGMVTFLNDRQPSYSLQSIQKSFNMHLHFISAQFFLACLEGSCHQEITRGQTTEKQKSRNNNVSGHWLRCRQKCDYAALCRIFYQDSYRVAPFKAQNMALNSFITPEGGEMGRGAEAVQAKAAQVDPHVDMNPALLRPSLQVGPQVIVQGPGSDFSFAVWKNKLYDLLAEHVRNHVNMEAVNEILGL